MYAVIDGAEFDEQRVDTALQLIREIDPELAICIEGMLRWEEAEAALAGKEDT